MSAKIDEKAINLGHNTSIVINHVLEIQEGRNNMNIDYKMLKRGHLSYFQLKKKLRRFIENLMVIHLYNSEKSETFKWKKKASRAQRWNQKHIQVNNFIKE